MADYKHVRGPIKIDQETKLVFCEVRNCVDTLIRMGALPPDIVCYEDDKALEKKLFNFKKKTVTIDLTLTPFLPDMFFTQIYDGTSPKLKENTLVLLNLGNFEDAIQNIIGLTNKEIAPPDIIQTLIGDGRIIVDLFLDLLENHMKIDEIEEYIKYQLSSPYTDILNRRVKEVYDVMLPYEMQRREMIAAEKKKRDDMDDKMLEEAWSGPVFTDKKEEVNEQEEENDDTRVFTGF